MAPRIVFGLGNPGEKYKETRHNLGFRVVERVAEALKVRLKTSGQMRLIEARRAGRTVVLVQPLTYMNLSGEAAVQVLDRFGGEPEDMLVIVDDLNLPVGRIRIRAQGSDGGHNGLRSLIAELGTESFPRIRIGIGQPAGEQETTTRDFVLDSVPAGERDRVEQSLDRAAQAALAWIRVNDFQKIMSEYNRRPEAPRDEGRRPRERSDGET